MKKITKITIHLSAWLLLLFSYYLFTRNFNLSFDFYYHVSDILVYVLVFYVNYYVLMPFLYKKKVLLFIFLSVVLLSGSLLLKDVINKKHFEEVFVDHPGNINHPMHQPQPQPDLKYFPEPPRDFPKIDPRKTQFIINNAFGIFIFYALSFSMRFIKKWQDDEQNKARLEKEKFQTELFFLKQQINPHFLFNSLNSIYSLAISKSEVTTTAILKLSSILRYVLYEPQSSVFSLSDEIKVIKDYIDLQQLRLTDNVQVDFQLLGEIDTYKMEPFILIPLIENAFKYGVDNTNPSFIKIMIKVINNNLLAEIANKIVPHPVDKKKGAGIGISNIKRRLELLYPDAHTFEIQNRNNVFLVHVELKLKQ